jgi:hypothetical protein
VSSTEAPVPVELRNLAVKPVGAIGVGLANVAFEASGAFSVPSATGNANDSPPPSAGREDSAADRLVVMFGVGLPRSAGAAVALGAMRAVVVAGALTTNASGTPLQRCETIPKRSVLGYEGRGAARVTVTVPPLAAVITPA